MAEFAHYRDINNRLKKRFNLIRKPNLKEASESFRKLSQQLNMFPNYSGYCMYSASKCEHQIVGSLKEQLCQTMGQNAGNSTTNISPGSNFPSNQTGPTNANSSSRANQALENLVHEAVWIEFQHWLETARIFREIDPIENDVNGAISAYAHAIQTCPSPRILTVVLGELGSLYVKHHRLYEAAEVYIEAGLFRNAINCLLRGHYYQDAYHCYQLLFKQQPDDYSNLTDLMYSSTGPKTSKNQHQQNNGTQQSQTKSSILSLFRKKKEPDGFDDSNSGKKVQEKVQHGNKNQNQECQGKSILFPPLKFISSPFDFSEQSLTVDDYINFFLLRLYLYDPVKYEYPSPIIPIPRCCNREFFNDNHTGNDDDDCEDGGGNHGVCQHQIGDSEKHQKLNLSTMSNLEQLSLPFMDMTNGKWMDRSIMDVIKLNHLLETLYLSYRNELRPSLDNEYSDFDIIVVQHQQKQKSDEVLENKDEDTNLLETQDQSSKTKQSGLTADPEDPDTEETECADDSSFSSSGRLTSGTRYDSKDSSDDDLQQQQQHQMQQIQLGLVGNGNGPKSPGLKLLETGVLDDIGPRLEMLAKRFALDSDDEDYEESRTSETEEENLTIEQRVQKKLNHMEQKWMIRQSLTTDGIVGSIVVDLIEQNDDDDGLRKQIARELFPLLNGNQIQLLYDILQEKD